MSILNNTRKTLKGSRPKKTIPLCQNRLTYIKTGDEWVKAMPHIYERCAHPQSVHAEGKCFHCHARNRFHKFQKYEEKFRVIREQRHPQGSRAF